MQPKKLTKDETPETDVAENDKQTSGAEVPAGEAKVPAVETSASETEQESKPAGKKSEEKSDPSKLNDADDK